MWHKKRAKILSTQKHVWPPDDWPRHKEDDKIKVNPKRLTYIDNIYKWCHCYNEKSTSINWRKKYRYKRLSTSKTNCLENEKEKEEWRKSRPPYPEYKNEVYEAAEEKKKEHDEERRKDPIIKIRQRYKDRSQTSRYDKVSVVSEAIYVGE